MKLIRRLPKKLFSQLVARKRTALITGTILCLSLISATAYTYYRHQNTKSATIDISHLPASAPEKSESPQDSSTSVSTQAEITADASNQASTPAGRAPQPAPAQTPQPRTKPTPSPTPSVNLTPPFFSAGRIESAYAYCAEGVLMYSLGGASVLTNGPTTQSFSWKIELNDGTTSDSGTDTMPAGSSSWYGFPGTSNYPSSLGTIEGAEDGDMARLVITAPNYSVGSWSSPVPIGSEAACHV